MMMYLITEIQMTCGLLQKELVALDQYLINATDHGPQKHTRQT